MLNGPSPSPEPLAPSPPIRYTLTFTIEEFP
jgi:hypothetical protein